MIFIITSLEGKPSKKRVKLDQIELNNHVLCDFCASYCQLKNTSKLKNILQNKWLVILAVLSTDTAEKTCSCLMVSTGPPTVYLGHILKQTRKHQTIVWKKNVGSYIIFPKTRLVSASGSDKRETNNSWVKLQLWVWLDFNSALKKCHEKNCPLSCVICFRKKKNFKHGDGCLHLLISTKKRIKITQMSQNMTFALKW